MLYNDIELEWDHEKSATNLKKHKVDFYEASTIWHDRNALDIHDHSHSQNEERWIRIGRTIFGAILVAIHCERNGKIRLISARKADTHEERNYYERSLRLL
jgi:uncharacterized DUF497 family protein